MSPVEQDTIDCEYLASFKPFFYSIKYILCNFLKKKTFAHENIEKPPSKVAYFMAQIFFQYCQPAQNLPKFHILFHKNGALRDFYIMTLVVAALWK